MIKIKNWKDHQHYQKGDRDPKWIKLYRKILDDIEWHELNGEDAKTLVMLWLVASESGGVLPDTKTIAFRLRAKEIDIKQALARLSHWLEQDDSSLLSDVYQNACLEEEKEEEEEREKEKEKEKESRLLLDSRKVPKIKKNDYTESFLEFWESYPPSRSSKSKAFKSYQRALKEADHETIITGARAYAEDCRRQRKSIEYIAHASTFLNEKRWEIDYSAKIAGSRLNGGRSTFDDVLAAASRVARGEMGSYQH